MPHRIQLSRSRGWRKPENTVVVARPTKWGNPFKGVGAVSRYREFLEKHPEIKEEIRRELRGRNLACWCQVSARCHGDVLLEVANS